MRDTQYFWDLVSVSIIAFILYPVLNLFTTHRMENMLFLAGIIMTDLTVRLLKYMFDGKPTSILYRPEEASGCDIICKDGPSGGLIGMPSGHMAVLTFALAFLYIVYVHDSQQLIGRSLFIVFAIAYTTLMSIARYQKKCHNAMQIVLGMVWGLVTASVMVLAYWRSLV